MGSTSDFSHAAHAQDGGHSIALVTSGVKVRNAESFIG